MTYALLALEAALLVTTVALVIIVGHREAAARAEAARELLRRFAADELDLAAYEQAHAALAAGQHRRRWHGPDGHALTTLMRAGRP